MAIQEDASTPVITHQGASSTGALTSVTSVPFSPPGNSTVVVLASQLFSTGVSSNTLTCVDSLGHTYTGVQINSSSNQCTTAIFWFYYPISSPGMASSFPAVPGQAVPGESAPGFPAGGTAPPGFSAPASSPFSFVPGQAVPGASDPSVPLNALGGLTVTVSSTASASAAWSLAPRVLTGVAPTASLVSATSVTAMANALTTTTPGSWAYVVTAESSRTGQAIVPGTLFIDSYFGVFGSGSTFGGTYMGRAASATVTPGPETLGWSGVGNWVSMEILPATVSAGISGSGGVTFGPVALAGTGSFTPTGVGIVQQVPGTSTYDYGWSTTAITTSDGNAIMVLAGWDLSTADTDALMAAAYVSDSAGNYWYHVDTSSAGNTGSRCTAWICLNARPVTWVSCSVTNFVSSLAYVVVEVSGLSPYYYLDLVTDTSVVSGTSAVASPGNASAADFAVTLLAAGSTTVSLTPPAGWTALPQVQAGAAGPNGITLYPFWRSASSGSAVSASYTVNNTASLSAVTFAIYVTGTAPAQENPGFPVLKIEMGFGFTPGDPSQEPPSWTDITARAISDTGETFISASMGRAYELTSQEAGTLSIAIDNHDGAFTPGNTNSPYYPNIAVSTPVRISAFWATRWYNVAFGYVSSWPQEFPDLPQWGLSRMTAVDAFGVLGSSVLQEALVGEMLIDAPYVLIPASEQYTTTVNGTGLSNFAYNAQGLLAANVSRVNQRSGTYVSGTVAQVDTGQSSTLLGDQDTGFGTSSIGSVPLTPTASGPGVLYQDPGLPATNSADGLSVEFWVTIPGNVNSAGLQPTIFEAFGPASNYQVAQPSFAVQVLNLSGTNKLEFTFRDGSSAQVNFSPSNNQQQVVCTFTTSSFTVYINSAQVLTMAISAAQVSPWNAVMLGCANYAYQNGNLVAGNFSAMCLGIYGYVLPLQRIVSHYVTGISGADNVDATVRIAQVLCWAALGIPRGGQVLFNGVHDGVLQGPAYGLHNSHASDPVNQVATNHSAMVFAAPDGTLTFMHRWALFNQPPVFTFGDSVHVSDGQVPYLGDQKFSYDITYLYNTDQASQTSGPNTGITVTAANFGSQAQYFARSALQVSLQTMSNLDPYDVANWNLFRYSQPSIRLSSMTIDAASNPSVAFPAVLLTRQGNSAIVTRNPIGGAPVIAPVIVQKVTHSIGPARWQTSYEMSPYTAMNNILVLDSANDTLGGSTLA